MFHVFNVSAPRFLVSNLVIPRISLTLIGFLHGENSAPVSFPRNRSYAPILNPLFNHYYLLHIWLGSVAFGVVYIVYQGKG
jgi:hypothetical protein